MYLSQNLGRLRSAWLICLIATMAVLMLAACGGPASTPTSSTTPASSHSTPTAAASQSTPTTAATSSSTSENSGEIKIVENNEKYSFSPATLTITKGTKVVWTNASDTPHTITSDDGKFTSSDAGKPIAANQTYSFVFNTVGTFKYHCSIHSYMTATITVTSSTTMKPL